MACALPLASVLRERFPPHVDVLRFEHDTWLPIDANASELAAHLQRLRADRVLVVAHSRGGLVARHTLMMLGGTPSIRLVTLGTPLAGTPVVDALDSALLGTRALMGAIRLVSGPSIDVTTRLVGWLVRGTPVGIASMSPRSPYLSFPIEPMHELRPVAAAVDPDSAVDGYGPIARRGLAVGVFEDDPNDLVVAVASALAGGTTSTLTVGDHFSFARNADALAAIDTAWHEFIAPEQSADGREEPPRSGGATGRVTW